MQRTTVVIGYAGNENDDMFQSSLGNITKPNPVYAFTETGDADPSATAAIQERYTKEKGTDLTKLNIVSHGSPGKVASLGNLEGFLGGLEAKIDFSNLRDIDLFPCHTMSRRDVDDSSVAYTIAKWAQFKLEVGQTLNMRAGYTSRTVGEFIKGNPSDDPISDLGHALEAHEIANYFFFMIKERLKSQGMKREQWDEQREEIHEEAKEAARIAVAEIVKAAPKSVWASGEKVKGQNISIGKASISFGTRDASSLRRGYTVASATQANYKDFPQRMIFLTSLEKMTGIIGKALADQLEKLWEEVKPKPKPLTQFTFGSLTPSTTVSSPGFTFGSGGGGLVLNPQPPTGLTSPPTQTGFTFGFNPNNT